MVDTKDGLVPDSQLQAGLPQLRAAYAAEHEGVFPLGTGLPPQHWGLHTKCLLVWQSETAEKGKQDLRSQAQRAAAFPTGTHPFYAELC